MAATGVGFEVMLRALEMRSAAAITVVVCLSVWLHESAVAVTVTLILPSYDEIEVRLAHNFESSLLRVRPRSRECDELSAQKQRRMHVYVVPVGDAASKSILCMHRYE